MVAFNPKTMGALAIVADQNDFDYFIRRAIENLKMVLVSNKKASIVQLIIVTAQLLVLATLQYQEDTGNGPIKNKIKKAAGKDAPTSNNIDAP